MKRGKCHYLFNVKGNPFSEGLIGNLKIAAFPEENGRYSLRYIENGSLIMRDSQIIGPNPGILRFGPINTIIVADLY